MDQDSEMTAAPDNLNDDAAAADHYEQMQQGSKYQPMPFEIRRADFIQVDSLAQQFMDGGPSPRYVRAASEFCTDLAKQLMELCTALEGGQVNEPGDEAGHTQPVNHAVNHAATAPVVASTLEVSTSPSSSLHALVRRLTCHSTPRSFQMTLFLRCIRKHTTRSG